MIKRYILSIFCFVLLFSKLSFSQQDVRTLIEDRLNSESQLEKVESEIAKDSTKESLVNYIKALKTLKEKDDAIIDLTKNDIDKFVRDTIETNRILSENRRINSELEEKRGIFLYSLTVGVTATSLFLIFMVLYLNARGRMKRAIDVVTMEKQAAAKYQVEMEEMQRQLQRNVGNEVSKEEYMKLKEVSDAELLRMHDYIKEKEFQLTALKQSIEDLKVRNEAIEGKYVNAEKEVEELSEALANLSQVSKHKIEEMEMNFMKIEKLAKLRDMNAISESEYQAKKDILMTGI